MSALIDPGIYLQTWCPSDSCDPCETCSWFPFQHSGPGTAIGAFKFLNSDGTVDQKATFCGAPYWGVKSICVPGSAVPGDIVSTSVRIFLGGTCFVTGSSTVPTSPPQGFTGSVSVSYLGSDVFTWDPNAGTLSSFVATLVGTFTGAAGATIYEYVWSAHVDMPPEVAIYTGYSTYNCVIPFTGDLPASFSAVDDIAPVVVNYNPLSLITTFYSHTYNPTTGLMFSSPDNDLFYSNSAAIPNGFLIRYK
jgi:hypothetical protein